MKKCVKCGGEMEDGSKFCPHCGTKCEETVVVEASAYQSAESAPGKSENPYSMKWHKFLMVVMIISGVLLIINGATTMAGTGYSQQGLDAASVYRYYPGLKSCDMFYGVALVALGVFEFIVRGRLKNFRVNGPGSLKIMYVLSIAVSLIYMIWFSNVTDISLFTASNWGSLGSSVLFLIINSIYYSKRSELFVN